MKAILLCGGRSSRMGRPKHWLPLGQRPLLLHTLETVGAVCHDRVVVINDPDEHARIEELTGVPTTPDLYPGQGPLAGLHAGLQGVGDDDTACLVGCDLPFLRSEVLRDLDTLLQENPQYQAAVPKQGDRLFPVCAVYRGSVRPIAEQHLRQGQNAMRRFLADCRVLYVEADRWEQQDRPSPFLNMNTPDAYLEVCDLWEKEGVRNHE